MEESVAPANSAGSTMPADPSPVLRCSLCNKTFYRESTLKRHDYYCRTRHGIQVPRSRACLSCVSTKTRCDNAKPSCSRCCSKGLECRYPARAIRAAEMLGLNHPSSQGAGPEPVSETHSMPAAMAHDGYINFTTAAADGAVFDETLLSHQAMHMLEAELDKNWDSIDWQLPLSSPNTMGHGPFSTSLSPETALSSETPASFDSCNSFHRLPTSMTTMMSSPKSQIPQMPTFSMPAMVRRRHHDLGAQRVSQLMFQTLDAYPLMMMRQKAPPPFLHPSLLADGNNNNVLVTTADNLEPWHNCMNLVYMANGKMKGSKKLFWRNVRSECERFCRQYADLNRWELLAAMQALAIYVIMRLEDGEEESPDGKIDGLLLRAVTVIAIHLMAVDTRSDSSATLDTVWKNWILEESRRRLCVLFQIINMLVSFEPADMCVADGEVLLAPLPAQKQLWEAPDQHAWQRDGEMESVQYIEFGLTKSGQLVKLGGGGGVTVDAAASSSSTAGRPDPTATAATGTTATMTTSPTSGSMGAMAAQPTGATTVLKWNEWCSGMDGIGNLVMLAACLIQQF